MQSPQHFIDDYGPRAPGRLFSFYGLFAAWYVFGIVVVQTLGIEPMYKQLTPFYGNYYPASHIAGVTTAGFLVALIAYAVVRWSAGVPISRRVQFVLLLLAAGLLCALQLAASLGAGDATLGDFITDFRWQLPVVAVAVVAAIAAVRGFRHVNWWDNELPSKTAWRVVITLAIFSFVFAGSVAMVRGGFDGISGAYSRTKYEYVDDIGKGITLLGFLRSYNELHPLLSMHAKVHPPGPVVILWIMSSFLFSRDALVLSLGTMAVGSFALLPLFAWVRDMLGQRVALTCCAFYTLVPSIVLFTATSADILFTPLTFLTLLFFWRALHRGSAPYAAAAGVMYALLSLTSFSLISLGAFFAFVGLWRLRDGTLRMRVVKTAVVMLASFLIFHGAFRLLTGFDVIECFRLSHAQFTEDQINVDKTQPRYPAWAFKFFNPLCWAIYAGAPATVLFVWRLCKPEASTKPLFIAFLLTLLVLTPLYLARGEGERSAMYVFPFIVIPAAHLLDDLGKRARSLQPMAMTFAFLLFQCWAMESYIYTFW